MGVVVCKPQQDPPATAGLPCTPPGRQVTHAHMHYLYIGGEGGEARDPTNLMHREETGDRFDCQKLGFPLNFTAKQGRQVSFSAWEGRKELQRHKLEGKGIILVPTCLNSVREEGRWHGK